MDCILQHTRSGESSKFLLLLRPVFSIWAQYWKVVNPELKNQKPPKSMKNYFTRLSNDWILWTNNPFWKDNHLAVVAWGYNKDINFTILSPTEFILLNAHILVEWSRFSVPTYFPGRFQWYKKETAICLEIEMQHFCWPFFIFFHPWLPSMTILIIKLFAESRIFLKKIVPIWNF